MPALIVEALVTHHLGPFSFRVAAGDCLCLAGPSGGGKSLLLRAVADLDPNQGRVRLGDLDRATVSGPQWRRTVGLLPAESPWWLERVGDHFARAAAGADERTLAALGFGRDVLGWEVARLSSGERQRLALARLLAQRPQALLLDEPTANLDAANGERVEALVAAYRRDGDAPVVWVSHDPAQARRVAGRRLRLEGGALQEEQG